MEFRFCSKIFRRKQIGRAFVPTISHGSKHGSGQAWLQAWMWSDAARLPLLAPTFPPLMGVAASPTRMSSTPRTSSVQVAPKRTRGHRQGGQAPPDTGDLFGWEPHRTSRSTGASNAQATASELGWAELQNCRRALMEFDVDKNDELDGRPTGWIK